MANETAASGLVDEFGKVAKHVFSPTMLIMMTVMALPAVAAAAPLGTATIGDLGMGLVDHYITMFSAPFTETQVMADIFTNTASGDLAASSYELGGAHAHGAGAEHVMGAPSDITASDDFQKSFTDWIFNQEASGQLGALEGVAGENLVDFYEQSGVYHPPEHVGH